MKKHTFSKFIIGNIVFLNIMLLCGQLWSQEVTIDEKKAILIYKFAENIEWDNENSIENNIIQFSQMPHCV